jgi:hypothetical protein
VIAGAERRELIVWYTLATDVGNVARDHNDEGVEIPPIAISTLKLHASVVDCAQRDACR